MAKLILSLFLASSAQAYQGGVLKNHGHTTQGGDGGQIATLTITGAFQAPSTATIGGVCITSNSITNCAGTPALTLGGNFTNVTITTEAVSSSTITNLTATNLTATGVIMSTEAVSSSTITGLTVTTFTAISSATLSAVSFSSAVSFGYPVLAYSSATPYAVGYLNGWENNGWTFMASASGTATNATIDFVNLNSSTTYKLEFQGYVTAKGSLFARFNADASADYFNSVHCSSGGGIVNYEDTIGVALAQALLEPTPLALNSFFYGEMTFVSVPRSPTKVIWYFHAVDADNGNFLSISCDGGGDWGNAAITRAGIGSDGTIKFTENLWARRMWYSP